MDYSSKLALSILFEKSILQPEIFKMSLKFFVDFKFNIKGIEFNLMEAY